MPSTRTTVDLDEKLLRAAKQRAAAQDTTPSDVVQQALRMILDATEKKKSEAFTLVEAGRRDGRFPSPTDIARILDDDDLTRLR